MIVARLKIPLLPLLYECILFTASGTDSSDYAVCFTKASQILTGNMQGQLRMWDIRHKENSPVSTIISNDQVII